MKKRGLGRSLNAILSPAGELLDVDTATGKIISSTIIQHLPIAQLAHGKYQPRREIDDEALNELASSIRAQGILQPILVRKLAGHFEIIAGERRWRAAQKIGLVEVPVIIKDISDEAAMAIGLIENIQRENLNAIDEALGFQRLSNEFSLTHQEIAEAVGRSRTAVSNFLRLLNLPLSVQKYLQCGDLEMGHARTLLSLPEGQQLRAAEHVVEKNLSVRETEHYVRQLHNLQEGKLPEAPTSAALKAEVSQLQKQLSAALGAKVVIQQNENGKGKLVVRYKNSSERDAICRRMQAETKA